MDINEKRLKKERGMTPKELLQNHLERDDIEGIIIIAKSKDGEMGTELSVDSEDDSLLMLAKAYHMEMNYNLGVFDE